jgi:hypothetical protein
MQNPDESSPQQTEFPWAGHVRLTRQQYLYATTRGRLPGAFSDWQCLILARGGTEEDFKGLSRAEKQKLAATTARWNAIPAVQTQIEYERAISLETRLAEPLRAWEARMQQYLAMAAGELPLVRTVDTGEVRWRDEPGMQAKVPERILRVEEYVETNLTALGKALEMQGRALSVFKDRQELSGPDGAAFPAIQVQFVQPGESSPTSPRSWQAGAAVGQVDADAVA